ncbi:hypothetical protein Clacol_003611 [Clathrus columnatus]|uniref:Autophagy-related protein 4 n=1 Tax=Clathrus columnatus TaxID=1419009 RepID=A0AAV5A417_9AGAM|nr:hypothetical protein Clacol_003611 [Clathrus columnatus]
MLKRYLGKTSFIRTLTSAVDHQKKRELEFQSQYAYKLQQKLKEEGVSSIAELRAKSKKDNNVVGQPTKFGSTISTSTTRPLVKPLNEIMDLDKIMNRPHTFEQIGSLWNGYHSTKGPGYLSASIPADTFTSLVETAKRFPKFIIPLERSSSGNQDTGHEFYYLEWSFYRAPNEGNNDQCQAVVLFTPLQEYKLRQEFAQPYLVMTHYPELIRTHQIGLMRGELSSSPNRPGEFLLSQNEAQMLGVGLQKFYLAEEGQASRKLLETFHQNKTEFHWEDLLRRMTTQDTSNHQGSKLQKLLYRQQKDRLKSTGTSNTTSSSSESSPRTVARKSSKLFMLRSKEDTVSEPSSSLSPSRLRPDYRPMSTVSDTVSYGSSSPRLSDLPSRLSGWISQTLTGSTTDLSLPTILSQSQFQSSPGSASPKSKSSAFLNAARHGKGQLDKVVRHILDSDSYPDKSTEAIWLMGVSHPGYESILPPVTPPPGNRDSVDSRRSPSSRRSSNSSANSYSTLNTSHSTASSKHASPWPSAFYYDFTSRVWLTYRSHFAPIRDINLISLDTDLLESSLSSSQQTKRWNWPGSGIKGWTSDTGWGCMLRTGQSMLANALIYLHLGRGKKIIIVVVVLTKTLVDWRRPIHPSSSDNYIVYVKILTWFFDSPSPSCPFSVHRMALAGKELGKDVGQWFGPSTAAGAIKKLVHQFPTSQLAVSVASDGVVFDSDVYAASNSGRKKHSIARWGGTAVLVLVGIRLGIEGVNPIYYEGVKALFTFPQSVGIAGGRPSSSYYFVGTQGDNLFYLDPHHTRPAITLRPPPEKDGEQSSPVNYQISQHQSFSSSSRSPASKTRQSGSISHQSPLPVPSSSSSSHESILYKGTNGNEGVDVLLDHYLNAYSMTDLRTFHCEKVRKMHLSGLDPSMLLGFLCKDEADYQDFRARVLEAEPPNWVDDDADDIGLESISEPELERERFEGGAGDDEFSESPLSAPGEPLPSQSNVTEQQETDDQDDQDIIIEDNDDDEDGGWVEPSMPKTPIPSISFPSFATTPAPDNYHKNRNKPEDSAITQHYPFPSSSSDSHDYTPMERVRADAKAKSSSVRNARARNGGRTQSGGIKVCIRRTNLASRRKSIHSMSIKLPSSEEDYRPEKRLRGTINAEPGTSDSPQLVKNESLPQKKHRKRKLPAIEPFSMDDIIRREAITLLQKHGHDVNENEDDSSQWNAPIATGTEVELVVSELSSTGDSLSILAEPYKPWVVIVPFALPQERIKTRVYRHGQGFSFGDLIQVENPNLNLRDMSRVRCKYFGKCAGCQYQMLSYEEQLLFKQNVVHKAYKYYSGLSAELVPEILPTIPSPRQYGYRTKITPHFDVPPKRLSRKEGNSAWEVRIGFGEKGRRSVMDIEWEKKECPIATPVLNAALPLVRKEVQNRFSTYKKGATLLLRDSLAIPGSVDNTEGIRWNEGEEEHICVTEYQKTIRERVGGFIFEYPAGSFFQNNSSILEPLTRYVRDAIVGTVTGENGEVIQQAPTHLVDAYCGSGLFSITLSPHFSRVVGIEISKESIESARHNAALNDIPESKCNFYAGQAEAIFESVNTIFPPELTAVIIDPPRKGCDRAFLDQLVQFGPAMIVYSRLPKLVTRSISLPIWKPSLKSPPTSPESPKPFSLTVPLPILSIRSSPPRTTQQHPIASCLSTRRRGFSTSNINSDPGPFPSVPRKPRRLSFPEVVQHVPTTSNPNSPVLSTAATVPLRPCCEACFSRVDAALAQEHWTFQWSSAAARKHSQSLCSRTMVSPSIFPWKLHNHCDTSNNIPTNEFVVLDEDEEEDPEEQKPSPF